MDRGDPAAAGPGIERNLGERFRLAPGDTLLLYTDGATEAPPGAPGLQVFAPQFVVADHSGGWAMDDTSRPARSATGGDPPGAT